MSGVFCEFNFQQRQEREGLRLGEGDNSDKFMLLKKTRKKMREDRALATAFNSTRNVSPKIEAT